MTENEKMMFEGKLYADFHIPNHSEDTEGMAIKALTIELKDDALHGVIHLPSVIDAQNAPTLIRALQAALFSLEGQCHNHPTNPIQPGGTATDPNAVRSWFDSEFGIWKSTMGIDDGHS